MRFGRTNIQECLPHDEAQMQAGQRSCFGLLWPMPRLVSLLNSNIYEIKEKLLKLGVRNVNHKKGPQIGLEVPS